MSSVAPKPLKEFLELMVTRSASDLHCKVDAPPTFRLQGRLVALEGDVMTNEQVTGLFFPILTERQRAQYEEHGSVDVGLTLPGVGRFRINLFRQRGQISAAVRRVHRLIKGFEELHLPPVVRELAGAQQGLVIVSGMTGSGQSTTLAALRSEERRGGKECRSRLSPYP